MRLPVRAHLGKLLLVAAVAIACAGGWFATTMLQDRTAAIPGMGGCWQQQGDGAQIDCLASAIGRAADDAVRGSSGIERDRGMSRFVRDVETIAQDDERLAGMCHPAMHELGRSMGTRAAGRGTTPVFPDGSSQLCTAGYVHGLAEGYLTGATDADVISVFPKLCHDTSAREGCAHGVGHALVRARVDEPGAAAATSATEKCRDLPDDFGTNCMNGVFMELAMRRQPEPLAPAEFVGACRAMEISDSLACWGYLSTNLQTNDVPLADTPGWCGKASLPGQFSCIDQYGRDLGARDVAQCADVSDPDELRERCVDGAIGLQVGSGHVEPAEARDACRTIQQRSLRRHCLGAVDRYADGRRSVEA